MAAKPCILEVLKERAIIGDGSYVITLEKRGYLKAGAWTPETVIENPDADMLHCIGGSRGRNQRAPQESRFFRFDI